MDKRWTYTSQRKMYVNGLWAHKKKLSITSRYGNTKTIECVWRVGKNEWGATGTLQLAAGGSIK